MPNNGSHTDDVKGKEWQEREVTHTQVQIIGFDRDPKRRLMLQIAAHVFVFFNNMIFYDFSIVI